MVLDDITTTFLGIATGLLTAILTIKYTHIEDKRLKYNDAIESLFVEIEHNRKKLPNFIKRVKKVKAVWVATRIFEWIDNNELSTGYGGYPYNFFKFDSYNNFMSSGMNLNLNHDLDYNLKIFYHNCKNFCAKTQSLEEEMRSISNEHVQKCTKLLEEGDSNSDSITFNSLFKETVDKINLRWDSIELEYNKIDDEFKKNTHFSLIIKRN